MNIFSDPWVGITKPKIGDVLKARRRGPIWYAIDHLECPHILIPTTDTDDAKSQLFVTRGITAEIAELDPEGGPRRNWIDIICLDTSARDKFAMLSKDIADALIQSTGSPRDTVVNILERWRWFWSSRTDAKHLSNDEALGLFAELWFLYYWINEPIAVRWWRGPLGDRHDFVHPSISIEVKAATVSGESDASHIITSIDQLDDPEKGSLVLFSLALSPDTLATNSLTSLVDCLDKWMLNTPYSQMWRKRLHQAGWSPVHANQYQKTYRIIQEVFYRIDRDFPRIVRSKFIDGDLPTGVTDLTYIITPAYVDNTHQIATNPSQAQEILAPLRET